MATWNDVDASAVAHRDAIEELRRRTRGDGQLWRGGSSLRQFACEALFGAFQRCFKAISAEGFQKIVHRVNFEGFDGVAVIGGDEDDGGIVANQFQNFETIKFGHLNVEEHQVGLLLGDDFDGFETVGALGDQFDFAVRGDEFAQDLAREFLVVHNHRSNSCCGCAGHAGCASLSVGRVNATR